jgi:hypothetical protein
VTYTITIPDHTPLALNRLLRIHPRRRGKVLRGEANLVAAYAYLTGVPRATGRRRVALQVTMPGCGIDPDAAWKSLLDALVTCGLLRDDSAAWCELGPVAITRGAYRKTIIILEDM